MFHVAIIEEEEVSVQNTEARARKLLEELRRRANITYRIRIRATDRLKKLNEDSKKLNLYYSALVTGGSVLTLVINSWEEASSVMLIASITLTYYMFYISQNNYQERAYRMEESFKALDKLKNMIDIRINAKDEELTFRDCKSLYRQYEQIISGIENHEPIDYAIYKMDELNKKDKAKLTETERDELKRLGVQLAYSKWENRIKYFLKYLVIPLIIIGICFLAINLSNEGVK